MTGDTVPVRVCALLVSPDGRVCVIRRHRPGGVQHSLPGGLLADGEQPADALRREIREELGLDLVAADVDPAPRFEQHQATTRPGGSRLFLRRHLVCVVHLPQALADGVALVELDAADTTEVLWPAPADLAGSHLYPDIGEHLVAAATQAAPAAAAPVLLPAMTDASYQWR
ncbi:NUDIX domain-containing protein [Kitasatospora sp. NPDC092948]|uniref:NUDIX domain-containing protein n=1 Tax=Kitasatospora sp. NPDC092948 TaxID=3364088 RepID=UPI0037FB895F